MKPTKFMIFRKFNDVIQKYMSSVELFLCQINSFIIVYNCTNFHQHGISSSGIKNGGVTELLKSPVEIGFIQECIRILL